jgi:hypothetical protein
MRDETGKRRVSEESTYHRRMQLVQQKHGEFIKEGKPWTNADIDELLEGVFVYRLPYDAAPGRSCYAAWLRRSYESIKCKLYKLSVRHPQSGGDEYTPTSRKDRSSHVGLVNMTFEDRCIIGLAVSAEGRKNKAHEPAYLAKLLQRPEGEVRGYLDNLRTTAPLMVKSRLPGEDDDTWNARIADEVMRVAPHAAEAALGR